MYVFILIIKIPFSNAEDTRLLYPVCQLLEVLKTGVTLIFVFVSFLRERKQAELKRMHMTLVYIVLN